MVPTWCQNCAKMVPRCTQTNPGRSWGALGALSGALVALLERFGGTLERLGRSWALLGRLGAFLGRSWPHHHSDRPTVVVDFTAFLWNPSCNVMASHSKPYKSISLRPLSPPSRPLPSVRFGVCSACPSLALLGCWWVSVVVVGCLVGFCCLVRLVLSLPLAPFFYY